VLATPFFGALVLFGGLFMVNLILAVVWECYAMSLKKSMFQKHLELEKYRQTIVRRVLSSWETSLYRTAIGMGRADGELVTLDETFTPTQVCACVRACLRVRVAT
jgi:hypothetical protein